MIRMCVCVCVLSFTVRGVDIHERGGGFLSTFDLFATLHRCVDAFESDEDARQFVFGKVGCTEREKRERERHTHTHTSTHTHIHTHTHPHAMIARRSCGPNVITVFSTAPRVDARVCACACPICLVD